VAPGVAVTAVTFVGQTIAGACVSLTVTANEHAVVLPEVSVAVQVTVVVPFGKAPPEDGLHTIPATPQLSIAEAEKVTTAEHWPASVALVMLPGHAMTGGSASFTVIVKLQLF